jgi:hypothetical protein
MADRELDDVHRGFGVELFDSNGARIGQGEDVYLNEATGRPERLGVAVGGRRPPLARSLYDQPGRAYPRCRAKSRMPHQSITTAG